jgi:hypothetical protein
MEMGAIFEPLENGLILSISITDGDLTHLKGEISG